MANKWPDGGEAPLTKSEKWIVGIVGVVLVAGFLGVVVLLTLSAFKLPVTPALLWMLGPALLGMAIFWVQPWRHEPPSPRRRK